MSVARLPDDEAEADNGLLVALAVAAHHELVRLELEVLPCAIACLAVELDLGALIGVKSDVLNLHIAGMVPDSDARDSLSCGHLETALQLLVLIHHAELFRRDAPVLRLFVHEVQLNGSDGVIDTAGDAGEDSSRPHDLRAAVQVLLDASREVLILRGAAALPAADG